MASITTCPKCRVAVGVPEAATPESWVRCPTCGGQFQLQAALETVPPALELVAEPKEQQAADPAATGTAHAPEFPTLEDVPHLATHFAAIPHTSDSVAQRAAQKPKNIFVELAKIVLGGMAGLILGYAILFWGFRVDPFHFARFLPAGIVPQNLNPAAQ